MGMTVRHTHYPLIEAGYITSQSLYLVRDFTAVDLHYRSGLDIILDRYIH